MPLPPLPPLRHVFDTGLRSFAPRSGNLDMLVQQQLELVARNFDMMNTPPPNSDSEDLIAEMGDYFTRTAMLWAQLTEHLAQGPHIDQESHRAHERSKAETHLSDLREVVRIDVHTARLRRIRDLSLKFSQEVQAAWRPESTTLNKHSVMQTSISPFCEGKKSTTSEATSFASDSDPLHFASRKLLPNKGQISHHPNVNGDMSGSESSSDDNDEQFQAIDMDALRQRGKGVYFCPKGLKCDKGGVDKDGNLVVFDRNSSFAIATNIANLGAVMYLAVQILRRKGGLLDVTGWRGTKQQLSITWLHDDGPQNNGLLTFRGEYPPPGRFYAQPDT